MKRKGLFVLLTLLSSLAKAESVSWDETFRESGKIYVVVGVITIIFIGLMLFLISQDRRIGKLEKTLKIHEKG